MKGDSPGTYHTKPRGIWPFKFRAAAHVGNYRDDDVQWTVRLERYSRSSERWLCRAAITLYPRELSRKRTEVNREWKEEGEREREEEE